MIRRDSIKQIALLSLLLFVLVGATQADVIWKIPVEHNKTIGETQGYLIIRDDKVVFDSREPGDGRVIEYANITKVNVKKNGYEFHIHFVNARSGKKEKYVFKFKNDRPENQEVLHYIRQRMGQPPPPSGAEPRVEEPFALPYRLRVELDLNGPNCMGTLVLREDKVIFETATGQCADRAFVKEWNVLKEYNRVKNSEFILVFFKYGRSAPEKTTRLRFFTKKGPIPPEVHRFLLSCAR